jgi:serine/threonine protein phosphatase PrpC
MQVKGRKSQENQDRIVVSQEHSYMGLGLHGSQPTYGSVFDGHGGHNAATHAANKMHNLIAADPFWKSLTCKVLHYCETSWPRS